MLWVANVAGGPRRVNHAAVGLQEKKLVFTFGGYCTGEEYSRIDKIDVHVFNLSNMNWYKLKSPMIHDSDYICIPYMRYGHTASLINDKAYIFGGRNDQYGACNILFCFDTDSFLWSLPSTLGVPPQARDGHSACVMETRLYIFGGFKEIEQHFSADLYFLESRTMTWHHPKRNSPNIWRDFHTSTVIKKSIFIFGGRGDRHGQIHTNEDIYDNCIYEYDTEKSNWSKITVAGKAPVGRRSHSAVEFDGNLYIFGGYNGQHNKHFADLWKFDPVKRTWMEIQAQGNGPCARRRQSWCLIGHEAVLFGGTCPTHHQGDTHDDVVVGNLQDLSDVYIFDFSPTLATLCKRAVLSHNVDCSELPHQIRNELETMKRDGCRQRCSPGMTQG